MSDPIHPSAPHHLPFFITPPGQADLLMWLMGLLLIGAVLGFGSLYLQLHTLPERIAHKSQKLQFEIVAILGLLALFTHMHVFWVAGLLLAMIDLPDFGTPLRQIAGSVEKIAEGPPSEPPALIDADAQKEPSPEIQRLGESNVEAGTTNKEMQTHA